METNQHFVDSLMAIKYHYQARFEECERQLASAREQLTHVNALLVEKTQLQQQQQHQQFVDSLMALRNHYQALCEEYRRQAAQAKEQLNHTNALLVDQLMVPNNHPVSMQALTVNQEQALALKEATDLKSEESPKELNISAQGDRSGILQSELDHTDEPSETNQATSPTLEEIVDSEETDERELPSDNSSDSLLTESQLTATKKPLLSQYENLTKLQAVESLLSDNAGTILHIDYIIRTLYGELDAEAFAAEKTRMHDSLRKGTSKGLWDKVPDQAGCYTIDLKLLEPKVTPTPPANNRQHGKINRLQVRPSRGKSLKMLPPYQQFSLIDAVEAIVRSHRGKSLTIAFVVEALYGDLSGRPLSEAKERVGEALWRGSKQKRWQRLPEQLGRYTLELQLLDPQTGTGGS